MRERWILKNKTDNHSRNPWLSRFVLTLRNFFRNFNTINLIQNWVLWSPARVQDDHNDNPDEDQYKNSGKNNTSSNVEWTITIASYGLARPFHTHKWLRKSNLAISAEIHSKAVHHGKSKEHLHDVFSCKLTWILMQYRPTWTVTIIMFESCLLG